MHRYHHRHDWPFARIKEKHWVNGRRGRSLEKGAFLPQIPFVLAQKSPQFSPLEMESPRPCCHTCSSF